MDTGGHPLDSLSWYVVLTSTSTCPIGLLGVRSEVGCTLSFNAKCFAFALVAALKMFQSRFLDRKVDSGLFSSYFFRFRVKPFSEVKVRKTYDSVI